MTVYLRDLWTLVSKFCVEVRSVVFVICGDLKRPDCVSYLYTTDWSYRSVGRCHLPPFKLVPVNVLEESLGLDVLLRPRMTAQPLLGVLLEESLQQLCLSVCVKVLGQVDRVRVFNIQSCHHQLIFHLRLSLEGTLSEHHLHQSQRSHYNPLSAGS